MKYEVLKIAISLLPVAFLRETLDAGQKQSKAKVWWKSAAAQAAGTGRTARPGGGERSSNSALSFSPNTCSLWFMFFPLCHLESNHGAGGLGVWGRRSQQLPSSRPSTRMAEKGRRGSDRGRRRNFLFPLDHRHPEYRSTLPLLSIHSLALQNMTISTAVTQPATAGHKCTWKREALSHLLQ